MYEKLRGLIAAPFTPFKANGEVNYDMIPLQALSLSTAFSQVLITS